MSPLFLVAGALALGAPGFDVSVPLGVGWHERVDGAGVAGALHYGVAVGMPLADRFRTELLLASSTVGPPWGEGVDAVSVARLEVDLTALAGTSVVLVDEGQRTLGLEALVGPRLRLTRVSTSLYDASESHTAWGLAAKGLAGPFATYHAFRLSLRAAAAVPWDRAVELWLAIGYGF